jgi:hypothetical protein
MPKMVIKLLKEIVWKIYIARKIILNRCFPGILESLLLRSRCSLKSVNSKVFRWSAISQKNFRENWSKNNQKRVTPVNQKMLLIICSEINTLLYC